MFKNNLHKWSIRLLIVIVVHFVIKAGDFSFGKFTDFTPRGLVFSAFFILYWTFIWWVSEQVSNIILKQDSKRSYSYFYFSFHATYSLGAAFLFNQLYRWGDTTFYNTHNGWAKVTFLNPELTFSLWIFYILIFSFNTYSSSRLQNKESQLQVEKLKRENTLAQYLNLKSQIEPHFLFNSLSVLSSIIHTDPHLASDFTLKLSRILRYVVEKKNFKLLPLEEEIAFMNNYLFLMQTRFDSGIIFENKLDANLLKSIYVAPVSLQLLLENAIKHNKFSEHSPLRIQLYATDEHLVMSNNVDKRQDLNSSTKQGLKNLQERYAHLSTKKVDITSTPASFTVSLPILTKDDYEGSNF